MRTKWLTMCRQLVCLFQWRRAIWHVLTTERRLMESKPLSDTIRIDGGATRSKFEMIDSACKWALRGYCSRSFLPEYRYFMEYSYVKRRKRLIWPYLGIHVHLQALTLQSLNVFQPKWKGHTAFTFHEFLLNGLMLSNWYRIQVGMNMWFSNLIRKSR